jgi:hypothetical protein
MAPALADAFGSLVGFGSFLLPATTYVLEMHMTVRQFSARVDGASTDFVWVCPCDEPDPRDSMRPVPAEPVRMWPISTRVNEPENDDPSIVEPIEQAAATAWRSR